jgi:hypothetical protein
MKTFPLTPQQFDALRTRLLTLGITLPDGTDGTIASNGVELKYHYDGAGVLTLAILKKPWIAPTQVIWDQVGKWIQGQ